MSRLHPYGSVSSLSSHNSRPGPRHYTRTNSSGSSAWGPGVRRQLEMESSDQSTRTLSLTSIVDMYRSPSGTSSDMRYGSQRNGTFYYDYSEDFDTFSDGNSAWAGPLAPVPTRAPNLHRARMLSDGSVAPFVEMNRHPPPDDPYESPQYYSAGAKTMKTQEPNITPDSIEEHEGEERSFDYPNDGPVDGSIGGRKNASGDDILVAPQTATIPNAGKKNSCVSISEKRIDPAASTVKTQDEELKVDVRWIRLPGESDGLDEGEDDNQRSSFVNNMIHVPQPEDPLSARTSLYRSNSEPLDKRQSSLLNPWERVPSTFSGYLRRSKFFSIEPGLSDLASLVDYLDVAAKSASEDIFLPAPSLMTDFIKSSAEPKDMMSAKQPIPDSQESQGDQQPALGLEECLRTKSPHAFGHKRKVTLPRIRTSGFSMPFSPDAPCTTGRSEPVILQPLPVSPAKRLRLQNSVPKLMKALPDLPSSPTRSEPCLYGASVGTWGVRQRIMPLIRPENAFDSAPEIPHEPGSGFETNLVRTANTEDPTDLDKDLFPRESVSNSMKLKVSRAAMIRAQEELKKLQKPIRVETVTLDLTNTPEVSAFSFQKGCGPTMLDTVSVSDRHGVGCGTCTVEKAFVLASAASTPITASSRLREQQAAGSHAADSSSAKAIRPLSPCGIRSSFSLSDRHPRLPKRTLSRIRERLAQPRSRSTEPLTLRQQIKETCEHICPASPVTTSYVRQKIISTSTALPVTDGESIGTTRPQSRGFRKCMCKWMRNARQAFLVACTGTANP